MALGRFGKPSAYGYNWQQDAPTNDPFIALGNAVRADAQDRDFENYAQQYVESASNRLRAYDTPEAHALADGLLNDPAGTMQLAEQLGGFAMIERGFRNQQGVMQLLSDAGEMEERPDARGLFEMGVRDYGIDAPFLGSFLAMQQGLGKGEAEIYGLEADTDLTRQQTINLEGLPEREARELAWKYANAQTETERKRMKDALDFAAKYEGEAETKANREVFTAVAGIESLYDMAVNPEGENVDRAQAQKAIATQLAKVLDPGSVVRENEYALLVDALGGPAKAEQLFKRWFKGETMPPEQARAMLEIGGRVASKRALAQLERDIKQRRVASEAGYSMEAATRDYVSGVLPALDAAYPAGAAQVRRRMASAGLRDFADERRQASQALGEQLEAQGLPEGEIVARIQEMQRARGYRQ